jgi:putative addiction module killer protein
MFEVRQTAVFAKWHADLQDRTAKAKIAVRTDRPALGNPGDVKPVGEGVSEMRIDRGPGYRVYFARRERLWCCFFAATTSGPRRATLRRPRRWQRNGRRIDGT